MQNNGILLHDIKTLQNFDVAKISTLQLREITLWDINFETDSESIFIPFPLFPPSPPPFFPSFSAKKFAVEFFKSLSADKALEYLDIEEINLSGDLGVIPYIA